MASFPGSKVHRRGRRSLGRGQYVQVPQATVVITDSTNTAVLTFSVPVVVSGIIPLTISGGVSFVSQTIVSATVVHQLWDGALAGLDFDLPEGVAEVATFQGGGEAGASGTF